MSSVTPQTELRHIPLSRIRHNPVALRSVDKEDLQYMQLVDSVKKVGVLNAINVREISNPDTSDPEPLYGLMDGLHRFSASQDAGRDTIPCQVFKMDDADVLEAQIIGNIHKIDTKHVEYAKQLQRMIAANPALTVGEVAARLGVSITWVNERLGLPKLTPEIQDLVNKNEIILTNAFALCKLDPSIQPNFVERAMTQSPAEFVPAAQAAKKEWDAAKRQGRDPNVDSFVPVVKLQKMSVLKEEAENGKIGHAMIAKHSLSSPAAAWAAAIKWVLNSDSDSIAAQRTKHEQRLAEAKKKKDEARAERERKAAERAATVQAEIQLAPGVTLRKPESVVVNDDAPVHV